MAFFYQIIICLLGIIVILHIEGVVGKPGSFGEWGGREQNMCEADDQNVVEVCQRCAKQTKSPIVYPMCCRNEDDVYNWCDRYINYGKQAR